MEITDIDNLNNDSTKGTRGRLLDTAEKLFCEKGFEGTSIRDIASTAGCNIASVNYYFGGKQQLYEEIWKRHLIPMRDSRIESINKVMGHNGSSVRLEVLLRAFADAFVGSMVKAGTTSRLSKLMAREYIDKHLPADMFMEEVMMPTVTVMQEALLKTCPGLDESKIAFVVFSIIGQLVHLVHVRTMFEQNANDSRSLIFSTDDAINHIVRFSAAGIRAYTKEKNQ